MWQYVVTYFEMHSERERETQLYANRLNETWNGSLKIVRWVFRYRRVRAH